MNVVYITSGQILNDGSVRRQALRVPEVLAALQEVQVNYRIDLLATCLLDDEFRRLGKPIKAELIAILQRGLFQRFLKFQIPYLQMISRHDFQSLAAVAKELRWIAHTNSIQNVYVVGPGLDEVPLLIPDRQLRFIDTVAFDAELDWFWSELAKAANA